MTQTNSPHRSRADVQSPEPGTDRMSAGCLDPVFLLTLRPELLRVSLLVGLSATLANAIQSRAAVNPRQLIEFYPRESAVLLASASRSSRRFPDAPLTRALQHFLRALNRARSQTIEFASRNFSGDADRLATAWREASASARQLRTDIDHDLATNGIDGATAQIDDRAQQEAEVSRLLDRTTAGDYSAISNGVLSMPAWAERREAGRNRIRRPASLERSGRQHAVLIRDASMTGLGLEVDIDLVPGEIVVVRSGLDIAVTCRVMWSDGGRCGVAFTEPVASSPALLAFFEQTAKA